MTSHLLLSSAAIERQIANAFVTQLDQTRRKKLALVVQGGGQRGIFTAGVFDSFLEAGFDPFELYIGTSAGALNLSSFISRQPKFGYNFIVNHTTEDEFFNLYKYLRKQKPLNLDWALDVVSAKGMTPLDIVTAREILQYRQAFACATRKDTLQDIYLPLYQNNWQEVLRASCAIPVLYNKKVNFNDLEWVDGGVSAAIPVKEAWKRGAELVVVVRTEPVESVDYGVSALYDWRDKIESSLPQYIEKLSLNQPLGKIKEIHDELTQRFLSITGMGSEALEMLTRYYQSYRELNDFLINPPEGLMVVQIAPEKSLRSRALLSNKKDLEVDYQEGKEVAGHFIEHFAEILNEKTTLKQQG